MTAYWLSTHRMTIRVTVDDDGRVVKSAPIASKFVGQPFGNLERWLRSQGGYIKTRLEERWPDSAKSATTFTAPATAAGCNKEPA